MTVLHILAGVSLLNVAAALLGGGLVWLSVLSWRDYRRWRDPNGHPSEFGDMTTEQLRRSERCQRQIASMDRGTRRS